MVYADPRRCADCRRPRTGTDRCETCGFDFTTPAAATLWSRLVEADEALAAAVTASRASAAAEEAEARAAASTVVRPSRAPVRTEIPITAGLPTAPAVEDRPVPRRTWSVGAVVLTIGVLFVAVAAIIFVSIAWRALGPSGRAAVLVMITLLEAGIAALVTRRRLPAAAEALWALFLALVSIDWFAARASGLTGAVRPGILLTTGAWGLILVVLGLAVSAAARRAAAPVVGPGLVAGAAGWIVAGSATGRLVQADWQMFWALALGTVVAVAVLGLTLVAADRWAPWISGAAVVAGLLASCVAALAEVLVHPALHELTRSGHGVPLLLVAIALALTALVPGGGARAVLRGGGIAGSVLSGAVLVVTPTIAGLDRGWGAVVAAGLALLVTTAGVPRSRVDAGLRWASGGLVLATISIALPWATALATQVTRAWSGTGAHDAGWRARSAVDRPGPVVTIAVTTAVLVASVLVARRWKGLSGPVASLLSGRPPVVTAQAVGAVGVVLTVAALDPPYLLLSLAAVLAAGVVTFLWRADADVLAAAGALLVAAAPTLALHGTWSTVAVALVAGMGLAIGSSLLQTNVRSLAAGLGAAWLTVADVVGVVEVLRHPAFDDLAKAGHGAPLLLVAASLAAVALVPGSGRIPVLRVAAVVVATWSLSLLVVAPVVHDLDLGRGAMVTAAIGLLVSTAARPPSRVGAGLRLAAGGAVLAAVVETTPWLAALAAQLDRGWEGAGAHDAGWRATSPIDRPGPAITTVVVAVAVAGALLVARGWQGLSVRHDEVARGRAPVVATGAVLATGALLGAASLDPTYLVLALVAAVVGGLLSVAWRRDVPLAGGVALVLVAGSPTIALHGGWSTALSAAAAACVLAASSAAVARPLRSAAIGAGSSWAVVATSFGAAAAGLPPRGVEVVLVAAGAVALLGSPPARRAGLDVRLVLEAVGVVTIVVAVVSPAVRDDSQAWQAFVWALVGCVLGAGGRLVRDRRAWAVAGAACVGVAYVLRLVASDVSVPEAYTAPFAAVALATGGVAMLRRRDASSLVLLGPGVVGALAPSLPLAAVDPASLRGLLLAVAGLTTLAVGVRLRLEAPFLGGAVVSVVLALVMLGPVALAVPRWTLLGLAGAVLLAAGVTWEARVRDGRAVVGYVTSLR